jgi:hypothetical protein
MEGHVQTMLKKDMAGSPLFFDNKQKLKGEVHAFLPRDGAGEVW